MKKLLLIIPLLALCLPAQVQLNNARLSNFQVAATGGGGGTITVDSIYTNEVINGNSSVSVTTPATANRLLVFAQGCNKVSAPVAPTYNSTPLTYWGGITNVDGDNCINVYYLVAPSTGENTLSFGRTVSTICGVAVISLSGVSQSVPVGTASTVQDSGVNSVGATISSATSEFVMDFLNTYHWETVLTPIAGETAQVNITSDTGENRVNLAIGSKPGAASTIMGWTFNQGDYPAYLSGAIKPAP